MANANINGTSTENSGIDYETPLLFSHYKHNTEIDNARISGGVLARFCKTVDEVSNGVSIILKIIVDDQNRKMQIAEDDDVLPIDGRPIFTPFDLEALQKLAIGSMSMLGNESERLMTWAHEYHTDTGRKEKVKTAQFLARQPL